MHAPYLKISALVLGLILLGGGGSDLLVGMFNLPSYVRPHPLVISIILAGGWAFIEAHFYLSRRE